MSAKAFDFGKQGDTIRAINNVVGHVEDFKQAVTALNNGDERTVNAFANRMGIELGDDPIAAFNAVKTVVADEMAKSIVPGVGSTKDRKDFQDSLSAASSPGQLFKVLEAYQSLYGRQLTDLHRQYTASGAGSEDHWKQLVMPDVYGLETGGEQPSGQSGGQSGEVMHFDAQGNLVP